MQDNSAGLLSVRAVYCKELARLRARSGWSLGQLSEKTKYDTSYLHRLEKGTRVGSIDAACALGEVYATGELLSDLWHLVKREADANRFAGFSEAEAEATSLYAFSIGTVPGLLQTPGYAEALMRMERPASEEILAKQVDARIARQKRLSGPKALNYRALLDESVVRRPVPDPQVWADQLERLVQAAQEPNVALQIVPLGAGPHPLLWGPVQLLWLPNGRMIAYVESTWSGHVITESEEVERLRLAYDLLRDSALSTADSLALLRSMLEDHTSCMSQPRT
ncbi:helix-turn-helix domain-containing protein [Streptomyces sp. NRRL F-5123]|uniref:helix-turn-helix domain-containing protein n=1 Tax=Streptomyces sp. NRRL F-5123 TaxID=1463856 RepID=UPI0005B7D010|nr:helix-turn-helix transcriptional regulator [Streptomyces sp. NRRL F-5123]